MGRRRRESGIDVVASLPWPVGVALGVLAYLGLRYGLGFFLGRAGGPLLGGASEAFGGMLAPIAWMALILCWIAAAGSFFRSRQRRRLLEVQSGMGSISTMPWREFEMLVGEAFRRQGYSVEETGLGGADGGIDLILRKDGRTELVQCKQWRARQVNVSVVREMWGLVAHHRADGTKIVCTGKFTADAAAFAAGKKIDLITGEALLTLVKSVQSSREAEAGPASVGAVQTAQLACPRCGGAMVERANRRTGEKFWGCSTYPRCHGTLST